MKYAIAEGKTNFVMRNLLEGLRKGTRFCCVCGKSVDRFKPYRGGLCDLPPICRELEVIGSDVECFSCPSCGSHDRERHIYMYFDALQLWDSFKNSAVLHVAPEKHLGAKLKVHAREYIAGDLFPSREGIIPLDVTSTPFESCRFGAVLCNHVLEHVPEDGKALAEIYRILIPNGFAILQTPYTPLLSRSIEDPKINSDTLRLKIYGQEDHVRLYGTDLFDRIRAVGFDIQVKKHNELFEPTLAKRYGVNPREDLLYVVKPA